jgi:hypothetical protein
MMIRESDILIANANAKISKYNQTIIERNELTAFVLSLEVNQ